MSLRIRRWPTMLSAALVTMLTALAWASPAYAAVDYTGQAQGLRLEDVDIAITFFSRDDPSHTGDFPLQLGTNGPTVTIPAQQLTKPDLVTPPISSTGATATQNLTPGPSSLPILTTGSLTASVGTQPDESFLARARVEDVSLFSGILRAASVEARCIATEDGVTVAAEFGNLSSTLGAIPSTSAGSTVSLSNGDSGLTLELNAQQTQDSGNQASGSVMALTASFRVTLTDLAVATDPLPDEQGNPQHPVMPALADGPLDQDPQIADALEDALRNAADDLNAIPGRAGWPVVISDTDNVAEMLWKVYSLGARQSEVSPFGVRVEISGDLTLARAECARTVTESTPTPTPTETPTPTPTPTPTETPTQTPTPTTTPTPTPSTSVLPTEAAAPLPKTGAVSPWLLAAAAAALLLGAASMWAGRKVTETLPRHSRD